ncbi:hypothetical protein D3C76_1861280 [compost metagenome]
MGINTIQRGVDQPTQIHQRHEQLESLSYGKVIDIIRKETLNIIRKRMKTWKLYNFRLKL